MDARLAIIFCWKLELCCLLLGALGVAAEQRLSWLLALGCVWPVILSSPRCVWEVSFGAGLLHPSC